MTTKGAFQLSHVVAGFVAIIVGYTGSVAIVFQAAQAAGASPEQINSWMLVLGLGLGCLCIGLSLWYKMPLLMAWSTPGAAVLMTSLVGLTMAEAIGAFILSGVLMMITGLTGLFDRLVRFIPGSLAGALLAGVLLNFCLDAFVQFNNSPWLVGVMLFGYVMAMCYAPRYAVPIAFVLGILVAWSLGLFNTQHIVLEVARPVWTSPVFSFDAAVSVAFPLFFITMASQNIPGIAVMKSEGYDVPISSVLTWTGGATVLLAPFGGFALNMAAITAAICASEQAGSAPERRYWAAVWAGVFYLSAAVFGATIVSLLSASPQALVLAIAGIALIGTLGNALATAFAVAKERLPVMITFLVAASGVTVFNIGAAFWSIILGMVVWLLVKK